MATEMKNEKPRPLLVWSINTPIAIPLLSLIVQELSRTFSITITTSRIKGDGRFSGELREIDIAYFGDRDEFRRPTALKKVSRYLFAICAALRGLRRRGGVLYILDYQLLTIVLLLGPMIKWRDWRVVYHQFELVEKLNPLLRRFLSAHVDLAVFPEANRRAFFLSEVSRFAPGDAMVLPNSTTILSDYGRLDSPLKSGGRRVVGHVGNLGKGHHWRALEGLIESAPSNEVFFVIVGRWGEGMEEPLERLRQHSNVLIMPWVDHGALGSLYEQIDIGLILYRSATLNERFCAPNKLYEYWSHGVKVIANDVDGLRGVLTDAREGALIDLEASGSGAALEAAVVGTSLDREVTRRHFNERHSIERFLGGYCELLGSL
ncbi:glycosyltransferase [Planctomycetota bacterium]|nr:glycosyltransferase [Planctomycetota bacterium]